jgi:hypothetical protein
MPDEGHILGAVVGVHATDPRSRPGKDIGTIPHGGLSIRAEHI